MAVSGAFVFHKHILFTVDPACTERDIVVTATLRCIHVSAFVHGCVHPSVRLSGFVQTITTIFMDRFQSSLAHLFSLTHSHTITPFDTPAKQALLKTLWEKEKLLVTSNFSFFHSVFNPFG